MEHIYHTLARTPLRHLELPRCGPDGYRMALYDPATVLTTRLRSRGREVRARFEEIRNRN